MKKFELTITENCQGGYCCQSVNEGFDGLEIIGILEMKKQDILQQIEAQTVYDRTLVQNGKKFNITEDEVTQNQNSNEYNFDVGM